MPSAEEQAHFMTLALLEAEKCIPTPTAFCVGAVVVTSDTTAPGNTQYNPILSMQVPQYPTWKVISTGYSREIEGNTHAEQCALSKLASSDETLHLAKGADMYTTMEPCSVRLSGNEPCVQGILRAGIKRVFLGTMEPDEFVTCEGVGILMRAGVEVHQVEGFKDRCLEIARRGR